MKICKAIYEGSQNVWKEVLGLAPISKKLAVSLSLILFVCYFLMSFSQENIEIRGIFLGNPCQQGLFLVLDRL